MPNVASALTSGELAGKCQSALQALPESESKKAAVTRFLNVGTCSGYIGGTVAGINLVGTMLQQQKVVKQNFICAPKGLHSQQLLKMFVTYVDRNKKLKKEPSQFVIYKMLREKYPCKPK